MSRVKSSIVATLGVSPPVITEFLEYMIKLDEDITDMTILYTSEVEVRESFKLAECAVRDRYPRVRVHGKMMSPPDITSTEDVYSFLDFGAKVLRDELVEHRVQRIYLNLSGGRKSMAVVLAILAQFFPVSGAYLVVARDVKTFNQNLERIRHEMAELARSPDPLEYYRARRELFEPVMYPPREEYEVVEIPAIPYPPATLRKLLEIEAGEADLPEELLERLKAVSLVSVTRRRIYPTDNLRRVLRILRRALQA